MPKSRRTHAAVPSARRSSTPAAGRREELSSRLKRAGLRVTPNRVLIAQLLARGAQARSVGEIVRALGQDAPDRVTVYRSLALLERSGLVREVLSFDRVRRYALAQHPMDLQLHYRCDACGETIRRQADFPGPAAPTGFRVIGQILRVAGFCADCA